MNRFSEMVMQGIAKPKYEDKFNSYQVNSAYHTLDNVTREYNAVWGALTGTLMRKSEGIDEWYITGTELTKDWYKRLMYTDRFDTTFFKNSFPGRNIHCLHDWLYFNQLTTEDVCLNGSPAIRVWKGMSATTNFLNGIFGADLDASFAEYAPGCTLCPNCGISAFEAQLDKEFNGLKCYANESEMRKIGASTLREALEKLNLVYTTENDKVVIYNKDTFNEKINSITESFKDDCVLITESETVFNDALFNKYKTYLTENQSLIQSLIKPLVEKCDGVALGKVLFPFLETRSENTLTHKVLCIGAPFIVEGVGSMNIYNGIVSFTFINENFCSLKCDENFINNLTKELSFFVAA